MPLSEKTRIEVYLPGLPSQAYQDLRTSLEQEFTYTFGGCTTVHGLSGHYLSDLGLTVQDRVSLLYTDASLAFDGNWETWVRYAERLHRAAFQALDEEAILIVIFGVHHAG